MDSMVEQAEGSRQPYSARLVLDYSKGFERGDGPPQEDEPFHA